MFKKIVNNRGLADRLKYCIINTVIKTGCQCASVSSLKQNTNKLKTIDNKDIFICGYGNCLQ
ncbi:hypothetical protein GCM10007916_04810 [Psychromonas marina]|uniref:Uncharacterized protein n=1 Tax=Psychromonas marina TaxID=88364 RepID=A0ABQ6DWC6_9GAMM|nr:hypothetical protein GCM10007916_04810 [Psychromonas marina]